MILKNLKVFCFFLIALGIVVAGIYLFDRSQELKALQQIIQRFQAESRVAQVLVTEAEPDSESRRTLTTIKFLEYDAKGQPLEPKYFTFSGNVIQFQSLVIRFKDIHIRNADLLRGKSAYLFWKVFMLDGENTQEYTITPIDSIPEGYKIPGPGNTFQSRLWNKFWDYALDNRESESVGIKNAQIEAPGTRFVPGLVYTITIEHDGGLRIDANPISEILKGEFIIP